MLTVKHGYKILRPGTMAILEQIMTSCHSPDGKIIQTFQNRDVLLSELASIMPTAAETIKMAALGRSPSISVGEIIKAFASSGHTRIIWEMWEKHGLTLDEKMQFEIAGKPIEMTLAQFLFGHTLVPCYESSNQAGVFFFQGKYGCIEIRGIEGSFTSPTLWILLHFNTRIKRHMLRHSIYATLTDNLNQDDFFHKILESIRKHCSNKIDYTPLISGGR